MKNLRERAGVSQEKLAQAVGKSVSTVSKWDQGLSFPAMYPSEVQKLLTALGCTLQELIEAEQNWKAAKG